ncbi:MAG: hypothetical protein ACYDGS_06740 [Thermoleophilia bacterium]
MLKKLLVTIPVIIVGLLALLLLAGCGDEKKADQPQLQDLVNTSTSTEDGLNKRLDDLKKMEMTVEMVEDGKSSGKWTQKDNNWRWDDANDKASYMIYNDQQKKSWVVNGDTAVESSGADNPGTSFNPATMLSAFAYLPSTNQSGDTWEFNLPGAGKLTMEFKGPEGLPSLMTQEDTSGKKTVTEFKYTNVGNVKASMFEMPGNVKMMSGPGTNTIMVPGGTGTSSSSMMNP